MDLLKREDTIHFVARKFLKEEGWQLLAGEYPNGSDDELHSLRIMDPYYSRDDSPLYRKHSLNKLVPDLIAYKDSEFLILEMKPSYSEADRKKLIQLISERSTDLVDCLHEFIRRYFPDLEQVVSKSKLTPALGFRSGVQYPVDKNFAYILVKNLNNAELVRY